MSETLKKIEALEAEIKKLKDEVNKPQFEVGKWYKVIYGGSGALGANGLIGFVINKPNKKDDNYHGEFFDSLIHTPFLKIINGSMWRLCDGFKLRELTDKEVEDALIAEAKTRGFEKGVIYDATNLGFEGQTDCLITSNSFEYRYNTLLIDNWRIFEHGKWATIIKDEPIKIGGYEVKKAEFNVYTIGCKSVSKTALNSLRDVMINNSFKKVSFDGVETDLETINKILDKL